MKVIVYRIKSIFVRYEIFFFCGIYVFWDYVEYLIEFLVFVCNLVNYVSEFYLVVYFMLFKFWYSVVCVWGRNF